MAAQLKLFTFEQLERAMSAEVVRRCLDDLNEGEAAADVVEQLQEDCAAIILARLGPVFPALPSLVATWTADPTLVPLRLRMIALDFAHAIMAKRFPTTVRRDFEKLWNHADRQVDRVRKEGIDSLGIGGTPEPATNTGGTSWAGGDDKTVEATMFFHGPGALGDF